MEESKNERTRMQAAMRLADVLTLREQREIAELRRGPVDNRLDVTETRTEETHEETAPVEDKDDAIERAFAFLKSGKATNAA
jgi:hypothetical protein